MEINARYIVIHDCVNCADIQFLRNREELRGYADERGLGATRLFKSASPFEELEAGDKGELYEQRVQNLGNALRRILVEVGVFSMEAAPSGPELIMAVEEYIASREKGKA